MVGILRPTKGNIVIDNRDIATLDLWEIGQKIGYVFQNPFTQISGVKDTLFEEVAYGLENFGVPVEEIEERVVEVMKMTDIYGLAEKKPFELSGGQQQRAALASIIVLKPDILVIDEPTSQLDPEGTESVFKIIERLKQDKKTIILVEHKVDMIAEYADEIFVMKDGRLIRSGAKQEILTDMSLLDEGVSLPQMAILGDRLIKAGIPLSQVPITEEQAARAIDEALSKARNS